MQKNDPLDDFQKTIFNIATCSGVFMMVMYLDEGAWLSLYGI